MRELVNITAVTHPFLAKNRKISVAEGKSLDNIIDDAAFSCDKKEILASINGVRVRDFSIKPKNGDIVELRAFPIPMGGGSGKDVLRIVLTIAVIALAVWAGGVVAAAFFEAGTTGFAVTTAVVAGVVTTVGTLAINALIPVQPPKMDSLSGTGSSESATLFISGARNQINPFGIVPSILGRYRVTPNLGSKPYSEVIGDGQYVRMLFVWGLGPIEIHTDTLKIGETSLSEFEGVEIEHREGYSTDQPLKLFSNAVSQEDFQIFLKNTTGWVTRTTTVFADEIIVDISFPQGLLEYDKKGRKVARSVSLEIEYKPSEEETWLKIDTSGDKFLTTTPASWLNKSGDNLLGIIFTQSRMASIRHGIKWGVSTRGQYDVRIRRTSPDTDSNQIVDSLYWTALKTVRNDDPVSTPIPVAKTALLIKATDQLNGVIDTFNCEVTSVCLDWDKTTETWIERATNNPASLFRHVLQGGGMSKTLPDSRIDLESLQDWHEFCEEKGFTFNMVRDFTASVWETLLDVASAGRASPSPIDGKWGVVIDRPQDVVRSIITPRNSFAFSAQKFFIDLCHGWRIRFPNKNQGYNFDERRVYRDGYSDANATIFESLELTGVTDPDQIYKLGRYRIAQGLSQMERWTFKQDLEYLTYNRGDRIAICHDVMLVGLGYGRITSITVDENNAVTGVSLDEQITMADGQEYGLAIRTLSNPKLVARVVNVQGKTNNVDFIQPIDPVGSPGTPAIRIGDIFSFGNFGTETEDALVISIKPYNNFIAEIICVPYREQIYSADTEAIPEFTTTISELIQIPQPLVKDIRSDETAMVLQSTGTIKQRILIAFEPLDKNAFGQGIITDVQIRPYDTQEAFYNAPIESQGEGYVYISDVQTGEVLDIRLRFRVEGRLPGPWVSIPSYRVIGRSTPPAGLKNMTISVFGGQALIRWDKPTELDVLFGGEVVFRHSESFDDATWAGSTTIGQSSRARTLFAVLPLKSGTYFARVYDVDGTISEDVTFVTTKQASVHAFTNVDALEEAPSFLGDKTNVEIDGSGLRLTIGSPRVLEGEYLFAQGVDLETVSRVRLTTNIDVISYNITDNIDSRLSNIDTWEDFDGVLQVGSDARVFVRHTDDDPEGEPEWTAWERLDSAEFEARAFQFKASLTSEDEDYNILVNSLGITIDEIV